MGMDLDRIKYPLQNIAEAHKRLAEAEERKAAALERIATACEKHWGVVPESAPAPRRRPVSYSG